MTFASTRHALPILVIPVATSLAVCNGPRSHSELLSALFKSSNYDVKTRPNAAEALAAKNTSKSAPPDVIRLNFRIDSLEKVDERHGNIVLLLSRKASWVDSRLRFNDTESGGCFDNRIEFPGPPPFWTPDLYYMNLVKEGTVVGQNYRMYSDGTVRTYIRQRLTLSCAMDLTEMPDDVHHCRSRVSTFAGNERTVVLSFAKKRVEGPKFEHLGGTSEFKMKDVYGEVFDHVAFGDDDTAVDFVVVFKRDTSYYWQFVIAPAILVVGMSYASFYVNREAAPARGGAAIVCFLTLANMITGVRSSLPRSRGGGIVLLDILQVSLYFCFYTVFEFSLGHWLSRATTRAAKFRKQWQDEVDVDASEDPANTQSSQMSSDQSASRVSRRSWKERRQSVGPLTSLCMGAEGHWRFGDKELDRLSRVIYAPAYIIGLLIVIYG